MTPLAGAPFSPPDADEALSAMVTFSTPLIGHMIEFAYVNSEFYLATLTATPYIPEPGTLTLFGFGLAGLGFLRRRRSGA